MTPQTQRVTVRSLHIAVGLLLGTYVYLPLYLEGLREALRWTLMIGGIPLITATGLWMWKGAAVQRRLARRRREQQTRHPART